MKFFCQKFIKINCYVWICRFSKFQKDSNEQYFNLDIASKEIDFRGPDM